MLVLTILMPTIFLTITLSAAIYFYRKKWFDKNINELVESELVTEVDNVPESELKSVLLPEFELDPVSEIVT